MDAQSFDDLARGTAGPTRRVTLRLLAGAALAPLWPAASGDVLAVTSTCAFEGSRCGRASDLPCCSGICKRKKHSRKRVCQVAPHQGICTVLENRCTGDSTVCGEGASGNCRCYVSTNGVSVCGNDQYFCPAGESCVRDADCLNVTGNGSYCVQSGVECGDPGTDCAVSFCATPCSNPL